MVLILMLAALAMQLMRAEAHTFSLWKLWAPFLDLRDRIWVTFRHLFHETAG